MPFLIVGNVFYKKLDFNPTQFINISFFFHINIINKKNQDNNTNIELENMFEEYLFIDNYESLEEYIHINCKDALGKNKFCEFIILKYFNLDKEDSNKIFFLLKALVKKKILFMRKIIY